MHLPLIALTCAFGAATVSLAQDRPDTVDYLTKYREWPAVLFFGQEREITALVGEYCRKARADLKPLTPSETAWLDDNSHMQDNGIRASNKMTLEGGDEVYNSGAFNRDKIFTFLTRCMDAAEQAPTGGPDLPKRWAALAQAVLDADDLDDEIQKMVRADNLSMKEWDQWNNHATGLLVLKMTFMENYLKCVQSGGCSD